MKKCFFTIVLAFLLLAVANSFLLSETSDSVTIDFTMIEKGIQWLEFINSGADNAAVKNYFMSHVAPTGGTQSIIHHWARFMEWNNETFYTFIMTALDRMPTKKKLKKDDGSLTYMGRRRLLWTNALKNTDILKKRLAQLKQINFKNHSIRVAKKYLPKEAVLKINVYFVLFGHSNAFAVGNENGFDFLQLPLKKDGSIDAEEITMLLAHEIHHTGFASLAVKGMKGVKSENKIILAGILVAEGMPTYFIDQPWKHLDKYKAQGASIVAAAALDWEKHAARLPELYREADLDITANLAGKASQKEIRKRWMAGAKGAAYVLGADMMAKIDTYLGRSAVLELCHDYRQLLIVYNRAARSARKKGDNLFIFNEEQARKLSVSNGI